MEVFPSPKSHTHEIGVPLVLSVNSTNPEQLVVVGLALKSATAGVLKFTVVVPAGLVHPSTVMVAEYVPTLAEDALVIAGFCTVDVKLLGPVQL